MFEVIAAAANPLTALQDTNKRSFHFCIVNLVIGTLYCVKGNFEFGIARIIKSMEPESQKLETDTWFYAKRCFLALLEGVAKHMVNLKVGMLASCYVVQASACLPFANLPCGHFWQNAGMAKNDCQASAAIIVCQRLWTGTAKHASRPMHGETSIMLHSVPLTHTGSPAPEHDGSL